MVSLRDAVFCGVAPSLRSARGEGVRARTRVRAVRERVRARVRARRVRPCARWMRFDDGRRGCAGGQALLTPSLSKARATSAAADARRGPIRSSSSGARRKSAEHASSSCSLRNDKRLGAARRQPSANVVARWPRAAAMSEKKRFRIGEAIVNLCSMKPDLAEIVVSNAEVAQR